MELIANNPETTLTDDEFTIPSTIKAHLQYANITTRWPCGICRWETDKTDILVTFTDPTDGRECFICEACVEHGADAINDRLRETAAYFEAVAKSYRKLADAESVWEMPSLFEARRFHREAHDAEIAGIKKALADLDAEGQTR